MVSSSSATAITLAPHRHRARLACVRNVQARRHLPRGSVPTTRPMPGEGSSVSRIKAHSPTSHPAPLRAHQHVRRAECGDRGVPQDRSAAEDRGYAAKAPHGARRMCHTFEGAVVVASRSTSSTSSHPNAPNQASCGVQTCPHFAHTFTKTTPDRRDSRISTKAQDPRNSGLFGSICR